LKEPTEGTDGVIREEGEEDRAEEDLLDPGPFILTTALAVDAAIGLGMGILVLLSPSLLIKDLADMNDMQRQLIRFLAQHVSR